MQFDRQVQLKELFPERELRRLQDDFSALLGCPVAIVEPKAPPGAGRQRAAINWELEPIGYLEAENANREQLKGAVDLLVLLVKAAVRYRMASDLHLEISRDDYETLQKQHAELIVSERNFRELSEKLEQKVAAQVEAIKRAQVKMFQSEKLASVGQLAAGMAHELNTPLAYILNNLASARDYLQDLKSYCDLVHQGAEPEILREAQRTADIDYIFEDFPALLADSLQGVQRASAIIADLKIFSNINQQDYSIVDINEHLKTVLKMIAPQVDEKIEITLESGQLPRTFCYPALLGQAFYNLILNAVQAIDGEGKVRITTSMVKDIIRVSIADTGIGIEEENLSRIFDPFFTTKEVGSGTGLGLSVIHEALKAHKGRIKVRSTPGAGTTFSVFLPVSTDPSEGNPDF
jgi:signal transduction histidine kinase